VGRTAWPDREKTVTIEENRMKNEAAIRELIDRFAKAFRAGGTTMLKNVVYVAVLVSDQDKALD
jgi:hypothetical protein